MHTVVYYKYLNDEAEGKRVDSGEVEMGNKFNRIGSCSHYRKETGERNSIGQGQRVTVCALPGAVDGSC